MFRNREEAGNLLAIALKGYKDNENTVIVSIPRGGVPIGYVIAKQLNVPLDIVLSKKIGHPHHQEFAIGAVTLNDIILNNNVNNVSNEYIKAEAKRIRAVLKQREDLYYKNKTPLDLKNKTVIIVDDGVATGNTLMSCIKLIEQQQPSQIIVALPVGPPSVIKKIEGLPYVKKVVCLETPSFFQAVGQFYQEFKQVYDKEVIRLLNRVNTKNHYTFEN
tara:strand:- start:626 stop:1279 length:654 start_codon:yes stop_codon:yes gene_type:complete